METPDWKALAPGDHVRWDTPTGIVRCYVVIEHEGREFLSRDYTILHDNMLPGVRQALSEGAEFHGGRVRKVYDRATDTWLGLEDRP